MFIYYKKYKCIFIEYSIIKKKLNAPRVTLIRNEIFTIFIPYIGILYGIQATDSKLLLFSSD